MTHYPDLNRAQLSYDYLHTNSTTHEFLFGAIVELVDNSRDANANRCDIFTIKRPNLRGGRMLCFSDDGCGMAPNEAKAVMTFGFSAKRRDPSMIGQYGNGLKSGAMRIGKDLILFTKKDGISTCVFLSRSFHEDENIDEVIVPAPSFDNAKQPVFQSESDGKRKFDTEMEIILKYSPFKTKDEFLQQFGMIKGVQGTIIFIYNLKLLENGEPELDFLTDEKDIRLSDPEGSDSSDIKFHAEKQSLRAYLSIIYANPHMKLYLQEKKITTKRIVSCLLKVRTYKYSSSKFKARAEKQIQEAKDHLANAQERARESESKLAEFEKKNGAQPTNKDLRVQWRQLQDKVTISKQDVKRLKEVNEDKIKSLKEPKILNFMFGINLERRTHDGCFIYNNGRLIRMYEKVGPQLEGTKKCTGVVGVVDIPFVILEPTHNKQDFADSREYRQLLRAMGEHMDQYWKDLNLAAQPGGLVQFWQQFGYVSTDWNQPPTDDDKFIRKRLMSVPLTVQCDACLKWRLLPYESKQSKIDLWDNWTCAENSDHTCNKCTAPEKIVTFQLGKLEKETVTVDQKRDLLAKKIQKQQAEFEKLSKVNSVRSSKEAAAAESRAVLQKVSATGGRTAKLPTIPAKRKSLPVRSPSPPPKKPRTKADLRRQLESKSASGDEEEEEEEEDEEDEEEEEEDEEEEDAAPARRGRPAVANAKADNKRTGPQKVPPKKVAPSPVAAKRSEATSTPLSAKQPVEKPPIFLSSSRAAAAAATMRLSGNRQPPIVAATASPPSKKIADVPKKSAPANITVNVDKSNLENKVAVERLEAHSTADQSNDDSSSQQTVSSSNGNTSSQVEELGQRLRRFLYYFLPPGWNKLTKQQVGKLTTEELLGVDLPEFFQAYEGGLKKLVADHQKTADNAQQHLRRLRHLSSKIVKSLRPEISLPSGCETEAVDLAFEKYVTENNFQ